jgi:hypothetical protein
VTVTDVLVVDDVSYQVSKKARFPSSFNDKVSYPSKIANINQAQDDHFIHLKVSAGFKRSSGQ